MDGDGSLVGTWSFPERGCAASGGERRNGSVSPEAVVGGGHRRAEQSGAEGCRTCRGDCALAGYRQEGGRVNLAALHDWLCQEHGYDGSLKSVQRYWSRTYPALAIRARRRVETPAGAQAQVDWVEFPGVVERHTVCRSSGGGAGRRGGGLGRADPDAVMEPQARDGLGSVEGHAVVAGLPDRLPPAPGRGSGCAAHRQREDGNRQGDWFVGG